MELRYAALKDLQNINRDDIHYLVAEDKGELIAFRSVHIQRLLHHSADVTEIQELIIKDSYRGKKDESKTND